MLDVVNSTTDISGGARLRALRLDRGLTVEDAATAAGVGSASLSRLERGTTQPRPSTAATLAAFYGVRASDIWMPGVLTTPGSTPMEVTFNPTDPYGAARASSGCAALGEITWRPPHGHLSLGMRHTTWRLLIPTEDRQLAQKVERARGSRANLVTPEETERARLIDRLTASTTSVPAENLTSVVVSRECEGLFARYFDDLLARVRVADEIEVAPAQTYYDYAAETDVTVPARTAPTADILAELEGFARHVPWLDTARKAVSA